ncbi:MAG: LytTR family transcriptional regulator DNA-binding domain-containing protein [Bacteroidaceae bacterium]|nr:LytTR family transcriptional regulator DNA-binding domain-containing protein [Bacteroidaceae bacterium]MCQ2254891.1 LytTR family transcriptional regulator DNA-binding domain-containing protein [Bacteroidaceae bacterium]
MTPIIFNTRDDLVKIDLDKMVYAEADGNYLYITMQNGLRVMVTMSLIQFEKLIENAVTDKTRGMYIRIGRKYIVDRRYIVQICLPKQTLTLSNMATDKSVSLSVPKEALKVLKQKMTE